MNNIEQKAQRCKHFLMQNEWNNMISLTHTNKTIEDFMVVDSKTNR